MDMCWPSCRKAVAQTKAPIVVGTKSKPPMMPASQLWGLPKTNRNGCTTLASDSAP
jgi:hypothetical protein